jgi:HPt (histidine-containing phosphotransfer) domain-containing protein
MKQNISPLADAVWNQAALRERVDHDEELLRELLGIFNEDFPRMTKSLEAAVAGGDLKSTGTLSHTLKGMLLNLGGERETALKDALKVFQREAADLLPELKAYIPEAGA